jgi:hypothetical protein
MRRDSRDELTCAGQLHRRKLTPTNTIFKLASIAKHGALVKAVKASESARKDLPVLQVAATGGCC